MSNPVTVNPYSQELIDRLKSLDTHLGTDGYDDFSDSSSEAFFAFWSDEAQRDLVKNIYTTVKDQSKGSIRPFYPNGFNPAYQQLTINGLEKLTQKICENVTRPPAPGAAPRWSAFEGYNSPKGSQNGVPNALGAALKPIDMATIAFDFDLNLFEGQVLKEEFIAKILDTKDAYLVRGNRQRLTLIMRQSECLRRHLCSEFESHSKMIYSNDLVVGAKIEVTFREGGANNIWGLHKSGRGYQVKFPDNDVIGEMSSDMFTEFCELIVSSGFVTRKGDSTNRDGRLLPEEIQEADFTMEIRALKSVIGAIENIRMKYKVLGNLAIGAALASSSKEILDGKLRFSEANKSSKITPGEKYPIGDGYRRNTTWQIFTDLAFACNFFDNFKIHYNPEEEELIVATIASLIEPDLEDVFIQDSSGKHVKVKKWSSEYTKFVYKTEYRESDKSTISFSFVPSFVGMVTKGLAAIVQNFLMSKKLESLKKSGKTINAPTLEQIEVLVGVTEKEDPEEYAEAHLADLFEEIMIGTGDAPETFIDDAEISYANASIERKEKSRIRATNDNWGIFPPQVKDPYKRFLRAQRGGSYASMVATIAALCSYAGYFQVTADPIDSGLFLRVQKKDGRTRYTANTDGNPLLLMQLLTGDSGSGKSYVIKPIEIANTIAGSAVNAVDSATWDFFINCQNEAGKMKPVKDYTPSLGSRRTHISVSEYSSIFAMLRNRDIYSLVSRNETYGNSDYSAEVAALRDAMNDTQLRMNIKDVVNDKLFAGTFSHPLFLFYDEASAFMEAVYTSASKVTHFCELKGAVNKQFRRANSNMSGSQIDIDFFGASLHGNLPLPKFLKTVYESDIKASKAEGVLGRILVSYIQRSNEITEPIEEAERPDDEVIKTLTTLALMIPSAMRRLDYDSHEKQKLSYFNPSRKVGNLYFELAAREEMVRVHERLTEKIEDMKNIYPQYEYSYDTYIGKLWEMIYTVSGGHKLSLDLMKIAERVIEKLEVRINVDGNPRIFTGWEIADYVKDRGLHSQQNNTFFMLGLIEALRMLHTEGRLKPIRSQSIKLVSVQAAEAIIAHHYDILMYAESLYAEKAEIETTEIDRARLANNIALAERNSLTFGGYRMVKLVEGSILRAFKGDRKVTESGVIRNMVTQANKIRNDEERENQKQNIRRSFSQIMTLLENKGYVLPIRNGGKIMHWELNSRAKAITEFLKEMKANLGDSL